jgi:RNA polymerase sigma factor
LIFSRKRKRNVFKNISLNDLIDEIRQGNEKLRNDLIVENIDYIKGIVCNITKKFGDIESTDEYSIGLQGFNEAIDCYDSNKNDNFYNFSSLIIKRRLINFYKSNSRQNNIVPFSSLEKGERTYLESVKENVMDEEEIFKIEIKEYREKLSEFKITLSDLIEHSPKRKDSRKLCMEMARFVAYNSLFFSNLERKKTLPYKELIKHFGINKKTVERNRKFIIASALIYGNGFQMLRDFLKENKMGRCN